MPKLYLSHIYYKLLKNEKPGLPRERFVRYYRDLHQRERCDAVDLNSFLMGDQYSYVDLGDSILMQCEKDGIIEQLDLMVICYWSHEFDPDYSCGAYFCEKYGISAKLFDVCDQGVLSPFTGMKIIKEYFHKKNIKHAFLLCFDQTTIPVKKDYVGRHPQKSSALGLHITHTPSAHSCLALSKVDMLSIKESQRQHNSVNDCVDALKPLVLYHYIPKKSGEKFSFSVIDNVIKMQGILHGNFI